MAAGICEKFRFVGRARIGNGPDARRVSGIVDNDFFLRRILDNIAGVVAEIEHDIVPGAVPQRAPDQLDRAALFDVLDAPCTASGFFNVNCMWCSPSYGERAAP